MKKITDFFKKPINFSFSSKKKKSETNEDSISSNQSIGLEKEIDSDGNLSSHPDIDKILEKDNHKKKKKYFFSNLINFSKKKSNEINAGSNEDEDKSNKKLSFLSRFSFSKKKDNNKTIEKNFDNSTTSTEKKSFFSSLNFSFGKKKNLSNEEINNQSNLNQDSNNYSINSNIEDSVKEKTSWLKSEVSKSNADATNLLRKYVASKEDLIGIEISPKKIRMIQLQENEHQEWIVKNVTHKSFKNVIDMTEDRATFIDSLREMFAEAKFQTKNIALSLPMSKVITKTITVPLMTREEMDNAIKYNSLWESLNQLPGASREYSIYYDIIGTDSLQNTMKILFVASKLSDINQYTDIIAQSELTPVIMDVKCFSNYQLLKSNAAKKLRSDSFALLEIGTSENFLMIETDGVPFIRDLFVSNADKNVLNIEQKEMGMISVIIERCALQITQNLKILNEGNDKIQIDTIYLSSDSPNLNLIKHVLQEKLENIEIIDLNPFENIYIPPKFEETIDEDESKAAYATCIALAKKNLNVFEHQKKSKMENVNLLPNILSIQKDIKSRLYLRLSSYVMIIFSILFGLFSVSSFAYNAFINQDELQRYQDLKYEVEQFQFDYNSQLDRKDNLEKALELSDTATTNQHYAKMVIEEIAKAAGFNIALDDLSFDGYDSYTLKGQSKSDAEVINYITRIKQSDVFSNVLLEKSFIEKEGSTIKSFLMKLTVKYDVIGYDKPDSAIQEDQLGI